MTKQQKENNKTQLGGGGNNKRGKIGHYKKFCFNDFFYKIEELTKSRETHTLWVVPKDLLCFKFFRGK